MKAVKQIITLLNQYVKLRDDEKHAKRGKEATRDQLLNILPPNTANEWDIPNWGRVTYHKPQDSLAVDLARLELEYPKAYKACVSKEPNSPRFCVYPESEALVKALKEKVIDAKPIGQASVSMAD